LIFYEVPVEIFFTVRELKRRFVNQRVGTVFVTLADDHLFSAVKGLMSDSEMRQVRFIIVHNSKFDAGVHFPKRNKGSNWLVE